MGALFWLLTCAMYCNCVSKWIRMPFEAVSGVGQGMRVLDGGGDRQRGRGSFGGKRGPSLCNQWDCLREGRRRGSSQITLVFVVVSRRWTLSCRQLTRCCRRPSCRSVTLHRSHLDPCSLRPNHGPCPTPVHTTTSRPSRYPSPQTYAHFFH